ncbi:ATP synthase F1 subunit gamma [Tautonia rosea]|uniref:ATP synthase F1 subunit gamma n=1 Tax=Tautonia rosea TaxID=2728037 RepID=UPI00147536A5|nr:ATP synthase F1 subunit gamma [Tautonia rosea]
MAKARAIIKRRKSVQNIKKITRTMELIATARFRKALDRATEAESYTRKIAEIVSDLSETSSTQVTHPLLEQRDPVRRVGMLVLTSNRGLAGSYNGNVLRLATRNYEEFQGTGTTPLLEVSGKRGISFLRFRRIAVDTTYTQFEDRPQFDEVEILANRYLGMFLRGEIDRFEVVYTKFVSASRQNPVSETLLPMTVDRASEDLSRHPRQGPNGALTRARTPYEFLPEPESILEEIVPASFKVRLFKCFLDAAVSEQIMRMIAMRGATENADEMVKTLTRQYNRARQSQITRELSEIIGGAAALG